MHTSFSLSLSLCSGGLDGSVIEWKTSNWNRKRDFVCKGSPIVAISSDNTRMFLAGADKTLRVCLLCVIERISLSHSLCR